MVHFKRRDLWYKSLVLAAAAIHWFNFLVYLMVKVIDLQCELYCDAEVVRSKGVDIRRSYDETIIGVVRYHSKLKTVLSTNQGYELTRMFPVQEKIELFARKNYIGWDNWGLEIPDSKIEIQTGIGE